MNCCGVMCEERSQRQQWFKKGSQGNLEATSYLPVLDKLMLFFVRLLPSRHVGRDVVGRRKLCLTAELPGPAPEHMNKSDPFILNPWTSRKFWTSFGHVKNLYFFIKKLSCCRIRGKDFFPLFLAYIIDYTPVA